MAPQDGKAKTTGKGRAKIFGSDCTRRTAADSQKLVRKDQVVEFTTVRNRHKLEEMHKRDGKKRAAETESVSVEKRQARQEANERLSRAVGGDQTQDDEGGDDKA